MDERTFNRIQEEIRLDPRLVKAENLLERRIIKFYDRSKKELLEELKKYYESVKDIVASPKSFLDGKEVMELLKIKPSKKVGEVLEQIKEMQLTGEIKTKEEAISFVVKNF